MEAQSASGSGRGRDLIRYFTGVQTTPSFVVRSWVLLQREVNCAGHQPLAMTAQPSFFAFSASVSAEPRFVFAGTCFQLAPLSAVAYDSRANRQQAVRIMRGEDGQRDVVS